MQHAVSNEKFSILACSEFPSENFCHVLWKKTIEINMLTGIHQGSLKKCHVLVLHGMKITDKISWLMGRVQRSLFPHLDECLKAPLAEQEQRLAAILEIAQVERTCAKECGSVLLGGPQVTVHDRNFSTGIPIKSV